MTTRRRRWAQGGGRSLALARALASLCVLLAMPVQEAAAHDGGLRWRTLTARRVSVHFPAGYEAIARHAARSAEDALTTLAGVLPYEQPRRLELTLDDYGDDSNGWAINFPYDHVHLNAAPPRIGSDLEGNGDWVRALVFHEIAHILHMGQASGPAAWVNAVLGRTYLPNAELPRFWLEGLATWIETRYVGGDTAMRSPNGRPARGGRVEGSVFLARLRAAALDNAWPTPEQLTGAPLHWPRGRGWYVFGSWLLDHQARAHGAEKTTAFVAAFGKLVLPFAIQSLYRQVFGCSLHAMWRSAEAELRARQSVEQRWRGLGLQPPVSAADLLSMPVPEARGTAGAASALQMLRPRRVSLDGEGKGRLRAHPDGASVVFAAAPADELARIERLWPQSGRRQTLHVCEADCDDAMVTSDGRWLVYAATRPHRMVYRRSEVFCAPLADDGGAETALQRTFGARARELALDPSGRRIAWVGLDRGHTRIDVAPFDCEGADRLRARTVRQAASPAQLLGTPALTDSETLFYTEGWARERRLWRLDLAAHPTAAPTEIPLPTTGWIGDLSAHVRRDGPPKLVAVVERGTFRDAASLDLDALAVGFVLRSWTPTGVSSAAMLADGAVVTAEHRGRGMEAFLWPPLDATMSNAPPPPAFESAVANDAPAEPYAPASERWREADYNALPTLRPFRWQPIIEAGAVGAPLDPAAFVVGTDLHGRDALGLYGFGLQLRSDLLLQRPTAILSLSSERWRPHWGLLLATLPSTAWARRGFVSYPFATRVSLLRLSTALQLPAARGGHQLGLALRLGRSDFETELEAFRARVLPDEPFGPVSTPVRRVGAGDVSASIGWARSERYPDSAVSERVAAWTLAATWDEPTLGAPSRNLRLDLDLQRSFRLGQHRVLALRGRLGHGAIVPKGAVPYQVVGVGPSDLQALVTGVGGGDFGAVRGLLDPRRGERLIAGRSLAWASAQLHLPLLDIGRGFDTLPLWLGRLWWTPFVDAAAALAGEESERRERSTTSGALCSLGAELRLQLDVGYVAAGSLRLGAAGIVGGNGGWSAWLRLGD